MSKWTVDKITTLGEFKRGKSKHRPRNDKKLFGGKYPFIQTANVKNANFYITEYSNTYNEIGLKQSKLWRKGTLCITIAANIAESAILNFDACFPDSIIGFKENKEGNKIFVKYLFDYYKIVVKNYSLGATQDNLSLEKLSKINFMIPDLPTQEKIANILSTYDKLIENNNKRIRLLEKASEELYKEWFVRMRFPGYEDTRIVNGVPEGWEVKKLKELGLIETGKTPSTMDEKNYGGEIPFIKTPDMHKQIFCIETEETLSEKGSLTQPKKLIPAYSICVTCIGTGGVVGITSRSSHTNQQINSLMPNYRNELYYLYLTIKNMSETIKLFGLTGTTMTNLSKGKFENLKLVLPNKKELNKFDGIVSKNMGNILLLQKQNQNLIKQRDLLLPRLMSGKLEV